MSKLDNLRQALSSIPSMAEVADLPAPPLPLAADLMTMMAVRGWCDPLDLLSDLAGATPDAALDSVAGDVETAPASHPGQWYLSASARQRVFATQPRQTIRQELERERLAADADDPVRLALRQEFGIESRRPFADLSDETLVAIGLVAGWLGENRPDDRVAILAERAARARARDVARLTSREMVGASHELAVGKLATLARAETPALIAIGLSGVGGAGKSTLLANLERELDRDSTSTPLVLLDFDDRRLDPFDPLGLDLAFLSRISARFPDVASAIADLRSTITTHRLNLRETRTAASAGPRRKGSRAERFEQMESLGLESIRTFESSDRASLHSDVLLQQPGRPEIHRLVLMLDTVEVVTARGMQAVIEVSDWVHSLHHLMGIERLLVIVSGRDRSAEGGVFSRLGEGEFTLEPPLDLPDLEVEEAATLLRNADVSPAAAESAARALPGNPLLLSITADLMTSDESRALEMAEIHESGSIDPASASTYLSTRIVAHVADPIARPHVLGAIVLPFLTRLFVQRLLIPFAEKRARMPDRKVPRAEADRVLTALRMTSWLALPPVDPPLLRLRQDLREFTRQLMHADPETRQMAQDLHDAAIAFHTGRRSAEDRASLFYHKTVVGLSPESPRNLDALLRLLGPAARDLPAQDGAAAAETAAHEAASGSISLLRDGDALVRRNNAPEALALWRGHGAGDLPTFFIQALADSGQWDTAEADLESLVSEAAEWPRQRRLSKEQLSRIYWITRLALLRDEGRLTRVHADVLENVAASLAQGSGFSALPALVAVAEAGLAAAGNFRPLAPETWLQGPRAGRQGRLLLVRFLNGQMPGGFLPLWDHIIVTDARWADRVADATGGAINLRTIQKRLDALNGVRFSEVNRTIRDLNERSAPRIEPSQFSKDAMQLLLRGTDVEFLRPFSRTLADWWTEEPDMREPFVEIVAEHVLNEMTIRPSEFDPRNFRNYLLSEPQTWMSALVGYADRCRLAPALCNAVHWAPGWSDAAIRARRVAHSWRAWDIAILGESGAVAQVSA